MALVRLGTIVDGISGTLGGVVFRNTRHGVVAAKCGRRLARTSPRSIARAAKFVQAANGWKALDSDVRITWGQMAKKLRVINPLGVEKRLTGRDLYMRHATLWLMTGSSFSGTPPANALRWPFERLEIDDPGADSWLRFYWWYPPDPAYPMAFVWIYGCRTFCQSGKRTRNWVFLKRDTVLATTSSVILNNEWAAVGGRPATDEIFGYRVFFQAAGYCVFGPSEIWGYGGEVHPLP